MCKGKTNTCQFFFTFLLFCTFPLAESSVAIFSAHHDADIHHHVPHHDDQHRHRLQIGCGCPFDSAHHCRRRSNHSQARRGETAFTRCSNIFLKIFQIYNSICICICEKSHSIDPIFPPWSWEEVKQIWAPELPNNQLLRFQRSLEKCAL